MMQLFLSNDIKASISTSTLALSSILCGVAIRCDDPEIPSITKACRLIRTSAYGSCSREAYIIYMRDYSCRSCP
ncbi:hypothetical protein BDW74DRAFT_145023 [Aspergillus multicolor]|uniref:uncharacterized protein n=1 Tax=Aspergillus multicolor TaxID=41759 RepID=UPI003CCE3BCA